MHLAKQCQISAALLVGLIFGGANLDSNKVVCRLALRALAFGAARLCLCEDPGSVSASHGSAFREAAAQPKHEGERYWCLWAFIQ